MKTQLTFLLSLFAVHTHLAFAAQPQKLNCRIDMRQFKSDAKEFPLIGDSNQRLVFTLADNGSGILSGEAHVRFLNDQSDDQTNSLYGAKAVAMYMEGEGLLVSMTILKFDSNQDGAKSVAVSSAQGEDIHSGTLKEAAQNILFSYINPKAFDPRLDLWTLVRAGQVRDYELYRVSVEGCLVQN